MTAAPLIPSSAAGLPPTAAEEGHTAGGASDPHLVPTANNADVTEVSGEADPVTSAPRRRRPRDIGTAVETATVRYLQEHGFPHAERRSLKGVLDQGDVTGTPGICWEIKGGHAAENASDGQIAAWLAETETERFNAGADVGVLVVKRKGISAANAGRWWAILPLDYITGPGDRYSGSTDSELSAWARSWIWAEPVRLHLATVVDLLRGYGYGQPIGGDAA